MLEGLGQVQARIQEIQSRIATLGENVSPPAATAAPEKATFAQTLQNARQPPAAAVTMPAVPAGQSAPGIAVPPASLGPLPPAQLPTLPIDTTTPAGQSASGDYDALINTYANQYGLPPALVKGVIKTESDGDPNCVSKAGAMGLMQLMPENVREAGISDPFDPAQNIAAGTKQLSDLMARYHGDLDLALAGYNAGPGNVRKYGGVPPFPETQAYLRKVKAAMNDSPAQGKE